MTAYTFTNLMPTQSPYIPGESIKAGAYFELTTGLANGDTITALNLIPPTGVEAVEVLVYFSPLDTNATPTGTFSVGDSLADGYAAARYISGASLGNIGGGAAGQPHVFSNVAPTFTAGFQNNGVGYTYTTDENSNPNGGYLNMVLTVTAGLATAAATGTIWLYFNYYCVGND